MYKKLVYNNGNDKIYTNLEWMVHLNNTCEITIVKRTPELTVDGKCLSVKIIYYNMMII